MFLYWLHSQIRIRCLYKNFVALTSLRAGFTHRCHGANPWISSYHGFDLARINIKARYIDDISLSLPEINESCRIHVPNISGTKISPREKGSPVCLLLLMIAQHDLRATNTNLTLMIRSQMPAISITNDHLSTCQGQSDGSIDMASIRGVNANRRGGLGQTIGLQ